MTTNTMTQIAREIALKTLSTEGDKGSCVMGMKLTYQNDTIQKQICQGSVTNQVAFMNIIQHFTDVHKLRFEDFTIQYGRMD